MASSGRAWMVRVIFLAALAAWFLTVLYFDPETSGLLGQGFFYGTLLVWVSGFSGLIFWELRKFIAGDARLKRARSIRQGLLVGIFAVIILLLQQARVLTWWDGALVLAGVLLLELYRYDRDRIY